MDCHCPSPPLPPSVPRKTLSTKKKPSSLVRAQSTNSSSRNSLVAEPQQDKVKTMPRVFPSEVQNESLGEWHTQQGTHHMQAFTQCVGVSFCVVQGLTQDNPSSHKEKLVQIIIFYPIATHCITHDQLDLEHTTSHFTSTAHIALVLCLWSRGCRPLSVQYHI